MYDVIVLPLCISERATTEQEWLIFWLQQQDCTVMLNIRPLGGKNTLALLMLVHRKPGKHLTLILSDLVTGTVAAMARGLKDIFVVWVHSTESSISVAFIVKLIMTAEQEQHWYHPDKLLLWPKNCRLSKNAKPCYVKFWNESFMAHLYFLLQKTQANNS